jgi:hypothetical protein
MIPKTEMLQRIFIKFLDVKKTGEKNAPKMTRAERIIIDG